jgi:hypothetical protein
MTNLLQSSLSASISIETNLEFALPKAHADANQFELAILNLAMGARDGYAERRLDCHWGDRVEVKNELGLKPGHYVCASV